MFNIHQINAFSDNYIWIIEQDGKCAVVDPGDAAPVIAWLKKYGFKPDAILLTHHHNDHCGGVLSLIQAYPEITVYGPKNESISGITIPVEDADNFILFDEKIHVIGTEGHTKGHISYYGDGKLFSGDALFSAGCGRLFEGTAEQMYNSLQKLKALPDETLVYCAHEYTQANLKFASYIEPNNQVLFEYMNKVNELRAKNKASLPSSIGIEKEINPFLRSGVPEFMSVITDKIDETDPLKIFTTLRTWKDSF